MLPAPSLTAHPVVVKDIPCSWCRRNMTVLGNISKTARCNWGSGADTVQTEDWGDSDTADIHCQDTLVTLSVPCCSHIAQYSGHIGLIRSSRTLNSFTSAMLRCAVVVVVAVVSWWWVRAESGFLWIIKFYCYKTPACTQHSTTPSSLVISWYQIMIWHLLFSNASQSSI